MANIRNWILAFAIAIVLNLFINYGISVFYKAPNITTFAVTKGDTNLILQSLTLSSRTAQ